MRIPADGETVPTAQTNIDCTGNPDASANEHGRTPPTNRPNAFSVQWDEGIYDFASLLCKETYRVQQSVRFSSHAMINLSSLVDTGACQNC